MAKVVNLRQARKTAQRGARRKAGDENAARHGLTPSQRRQQAQDAARAAHQLDQHQRDRGNGDDA